MKLKIGGTKIKNRMEEIMIAFGERNDFRAIVSMRGVEGVQRGAD